MKRVCAAFTIIALLLALCACGPNSAAWQEQYDLGVRYLSEGNYEEAILAFNAAIEIDPKQADAYIGLGDAYMGVADFDEAAETYQEAIDLEAGAEYYLRLANSYLAQENLEEAINILREGFDATDEPMLREQIAAMQQVSTFQGGIFAWGEDYLNAPIPDVVVTLRDAETGAVVLSYKTGDEGLYHGYIVAGEYEIFAHAEGYLPAKVYKAIEQGETVYVENLYLLPEGEEGAGTIRGTVYSAVTGQPIEDAEIWVVANWNQQIINEEEMTAEWNQQNADSEDVAADMDQQDPTEESLFWAFFGWGRTEADQGQQASDGENAIQIVPDWVLTMADRNRQDTESSGAVRAVTDRDGSYAISGQEVGYYTIFASCDGYVTSSVNVVVSESYEANWDIMLSPRLAGGEKLRIVLTWGNTPNDLDSHLIMDQENWKNGFTGWNDTYFNSMTCYDENSALVAALDVDDTSSYGPETITVYDLQEHTFTYVVHDFTNKGMTNSTALSESEAMVVVYGANGILGTFHVPVNMRGTAWVVFSVDGSGVLRGIGEMTEPGDGIQY